MNENSLKNLIPFNELDPEKQREISRKGGIASGIARREAKTFKETFGNILDIQLSEMLKKIKKDLSLIHI